MFAAVSLMLFNLQDSTAKKTGADDYLRFSLKVCDDQGNPINGASVITSNGAFHSFTDDSGNVFITAKDKSLIIIEAHDFEPQVIAVSKNNLVETVNMTESSLAPLQSALPGVVETVKGSDLRSYPDLVIANALQGRVSGLKVISGNGGINRNIPAMYIRGQYQPLVLIDGMERDLNDITAVEIERIDVLKDVSARILYGPRGANGVISVTTKRGKSNTFVMHANAESGVKMAARLPEFLNSYDYATLYNEALVNDGALPQYTDEQLLGYKNSAGVNDILYPNVDWYDLALGKTALYRRASFDLSGGNNKLKYLLALNYEGENGFEKIGPRPDFNQLNVRGNIDARVTDFLKLAVDIAAVYSVNEMGRYDNNGFMSQISSLRPNRYPLVIPDDLLGLEPNEDGVPYFGASMLEVNNFYADMEYGGFNQWRHLNTYANLGLCLDLNEYVEGLAASTWLNYDTFHYDAVGKAVNYPTYAYRGPDIYHPEFKVIRPESLEATHHLTGYNINQAIAWNSDVEYQRNFSGHHLLSAKFAYRYYNREVVSEAPNVINENASLSAAYCYDGKYCIEGSAALMGSNRFAHGHRNFLAYSAGAGWVISNEKFMDNGNVDHLKIKASFGRLGNDGNIPYNLYDTRWRNGGDNLFGEQNKGFKAHTTLFVRYGTDIKWETLTSGNIGIEGSFFGRKLNFEVNYFRDIRDRIITGTSHRHANVRGDFWTYENGGKFSNHGFDAYINWMDKKGDFEYSIGLNGTWSRDCNLQWEQVLYPDEGTRSVGKPTDVFIGFKSRGLFGKDVPLEGAPKQMLGPYQEGDIAYEDINGDNIVDQRDLVSLGSSHPRAVLGIDVNLKYKNWSLYLLGTSNVGFYKMRTNDYYQPNGEEKYSVMAQERWHKDNNPSGSYPRLTATAATNNSVWSDFWLQDASFFRLKNAELGYTFEFPESAFKRLKIFARGTNLFVISGERNLDPELPDAGISQYPAYRTITGGISITL